MSLGGRDYTVPFKVARQRRIMAARGEPAFVGRRPFRLLYIDIETTPITALVWNTRQPHIGPDQIVEPYSLLCFAARWHGETSTVFHASRQRSGEKFRAMVRAAHKLLSEADVVCHYNGNRFDIPRLNQEFARLEMPPPSPAHHIDLWRVVASRFDLVSSKLEFVAPYLKLGSKKKNAGWPLWRGCMDNNAASWREMEAYCRADVELLPKVYERLRPWIANHPNMAHFTDDSVRVCPFCGSPRVAPNGIRPAATYMYRRYACRKCGGTSRERLSTREAGVPPLLRPL